MAKESKPKAAPKKTTTKSASAAAVKKTTTKSATVKHAPPKAAATKAAAPKAAAPKPVAKSRKQTQFGGGGAPMVDTNFAAEAAARMLAGRARLAKSGPQAQPAAESGRESGAFKQMKENLNKPAGGGMAAAMGNTFGPSKSNLPNPEKGSVVRDQTTSSVNRVNVPRRTGG